jgi:hypothetical protein
MGTPRDPALVKPICGLLLADPSLLEQVQPALQSIFGKLDCRSEVRPWHWSTYYAREMGEQLWRCWMSFATLAPPDELVHWKLATNELEHQLAREGRRVVNADPGYIAALKLVLASTKDAPHRIYLAKGIYAEVTLVFERGNFVPLPYTYRDYAEDTTRNFFAGVRSRYLVQQRLARP